MTNKIEFLYSVRSFTMMVEKLYVIRNDKNTRIRNNGFLEIILGWTSNEDISRRKLLTVMEVTLLNDQSPVVNAVNRGRSNNWI